MTGGEAAAGAPANKNGPGGRRPARPQGGSRPRARINLRSAITGALLWCVTAALLAAGVANAGAMRQYSPISLRYETPVSGQAAYQSRQYAVQSGGEDSFWPTFWHETRMSVKSENNVTEARCVLFSGDAGLVWPARYLEGAAPGVTDGAGCAVSSALAWELWGGMDVVGKTVESDGEYRTVRGVFEGGEPLALLSVRDEDKERSFTAVELSGGPGSPGRSEVLSFLSAAGLGRPDSVLLGAPGALGALLSALPVLTLAIYWLALCAGRLRRLPSVLRGLILFFALVGFALLLPAVLAALPESMIPTRWSDFSFWGNLARQLREDFLEYFALTPRLRDVELKVLMVKQAVIAFLSCCCALCICFRQHGRRRAEDGGKHG